MHWIKLNIEFGVDDFFYITRISKETVCEWQGENMEKHVEMCVVTAVFLLSLQTMGSGPHKPVARFMVIAPISNPVIYPIMIKEYPLGLRWTRHVLLSESKGK